MKGRTQHIAELLQIAKHVAIIMDDRNLLPNDLTNSSISIDLMFFVAIGKWVGHRPKQMKRHKKNHFRDN